MALCLYSTKEPGYRALDLDELTNEQAIEIGDMIHRVALLHSRLDHVFPMSTRLQRTLFQYMDPKVLTLGDLRKKPLTDWRKHPFMNFHIYNELRESVLPIIRQFNWHMPAWEMLP